MKKAKIFYLILFLIIMASVGVHYFTSKFDAGSCIQASDGYIWHVNRYGLGKYSVMGWQKPWWGNEVVIEKEILESLISNIPRYHVIECPLPEFN